MQAFRRRLADDFPHYRRLSIRFLQLGCFVHLVNEHVIEVRSCAGPSMYPTLALSGDVLVSLRMSTLRTFITRTPPHVARGDLIDFVSPRDPTYSACKRVIGIEGDVVCLDPSKPPSAFTKQLMRAAHVAEERERRKKGAAILPAHTEASEEASTEEQDDIAAIPHPFELESGPYIKVPTGYVWVVGDNLSNSEDSRQNGPLPLGLIRGKIIARVWPLSKAQWLTASRDSASVKTHIPVIPE